MPARSVRSVLPTVIRFVLLALVIGFAFAYLARQWGAVSTAVARLSPVALAGSMLFLVLGLVAATVAWVALLNGLGSHVPPLRAAQISLVGALGKYLPGSLWAYLMQMELGRAHGVSRSRVLITTLYAAGVGVVASLLLGGLALPTILAGRTELLWLFVLLPIGLIGLHPTVMTWLASTVLRIAKRPPLEEAISLRTVLVAMAWTLLAYAFYGAHLWLLARALVPADLPLLLLLTGSIALGFSASLFAFFLPSGVGVREALLIGAMSLVMSEAEGSAVSLVSRVFFTIGDLGIAGAAAIAAVAARRVLDRAATGDSEAPQQIAGAPGTTGYGEDS